MGDSKRVKLTEKTIQKMRYEGAENSRDVRWDEEVRGFGVRIYPSGRKCFVLSYRFNNRKGTDAERFAGVLDAVTGRRVTYGELTGRPADL